MSLLPKSSGSLRVIRSEENGGPAGGWAIALHYFLASDFTHAWLMDDDMLPEPKGLATLWDAVSDAAASACVFPIAIQPDGSVGRWGSWCGLLISREIVETVGLPMEALFWWAEDTDYLEWRIPEAGYSRARNRPGGRASRCHPQAAGVFDAIATEAIGAYDKIIGLDLSEVAVDGSLHKSSSQPCWRLGNGQEPDRSGQARVEVVGPHRRQGHPHRLDQRRGQSQRLAPPRAHLRPRRRARSSRRHRDDLAGPGLRLRSHAPAADPPPHR